MAPSLPLQVGDLVYLYADRSKLRARDRYIVSKIEGEWCFLRKFAGAQLRAQSYKMKRAECYLVPAALPPRRYLYPKALATLGDDDEETYLEQLPQSDENQLPPPDEPPQAPADLLRPHESAPSDITHDPEDVPLDNEQALTTEASTVVTVNQRPQRDRQRPKYLEGFVCD